jgi:DNA-binding transcriptional MerR regulator
MYKIGLFSKINKITVKTLRHYDEIGLLKPAHIDIETGYRYYSSEQLPKINKRIARSNCCFNETSYSKL